MTSDRNTEGLQRHNSASREKAAAKQVALAVAALAEINAQDDTKPRRRVGHNQIAALELRIAYPQESLKQLAERAGITKDAYWRNLQRGMDRGKPKMEQEQSQSTRARAYRRQQRSKLAVNAESILAGLDNPITVDNLRLTDVSTILRMSRSALTNVIRRNYDELIADGYTPGKRGEPSQLTRRAIFRVALILRPGTSEVADQISQAVNYHHRKPGHATTVGGLTRSHIMQAASHLDKATELAVAVRDEDPRELWMQLSRMDRYRLQAAVVALASLVPVEGYSVKALTGWLEELAAKHPEHRSPSGGLALLLPTRNQDRELDRLRAAYATRSPGYSGGDDKEGAA